jgi:hypothetical protein
MAKWQLGGDPKYQMGGIVWAKGIILSTFQSAGNMSELKQKLKKFVMWGRR